MTREQIIAGLQEAAAYFRSSFDAMYGTAACEKFRNWTDAIEHVLTLLKAQEPIEPTIGGDADGPCRNWWYQCGKCKESIDYHDKYCRNCGQAVKWE